MIFCNGKIRLEKNAVGNYYYYKVLPIFNANFFKDYYDEMPEAVKVVQRNGELEQANAVTTGYKAEYGYHTGISSDMGAEAVDSIDILRPAISNIYKFLRNFAIVAMMLVLLYIGIRIIISSAGKEQSKYKQMLIDWVVGLCLLFIMHYIMSFIMNVTDIFVDMLANDETQSYYIGFDELGAAEDAWSGENEEWYEFFDEYHDPRFINMHLALRAQNDAGVIIGQSETKAIRKEDLSVNTALSITNPFALMQFKMNDIQSILVYDWQEWEKTNLRGSKADSELGYSEDSAKYVGLSTSDKGKRRKTKSIYHRTIDKNGNITVAAARDRVIYLGKVRSTWGKDGTVTLNAIITADDEDDDGAFPDYRHICIYRGNLMEYVRTISSYGSAYVHIYDDNSSTGFASGDDKFHAVGNGILYLALVVETVMFVFIYFKRLLQLSFLTMIAPIVALMYPLDKVGDGKAQAFNTWFKDYLFNALLQPLHLLLYTIFITAAVDLFQKNIIYALMVYAFMIPSEKYFKKLLGFEKASTGGGSPIMGALGGPLAMEGFRGLTGLGPGRRGGGSGKSGRKSIKMTNRRKATEGGSGGGAPSASGRAPASSGRFSSSRGGGLGGDAGGSGKTPNASGFGGKGNVPDALPKKDKDKSGGWGSAIGKTIKGATSRALTGGAHSGLKGLSPEEKLKSIGGNLGRRALRLGGRAVGAAAMGSAGLMVGAATAMATGDVKSLFRGTTTGVAAGWNRGGQFGDAVSDGIGGLVSDASAFRANEDQEYADKVLGDEAISKFHENGIDLTDDQISKVRAVSPYKDLGGDEDKLSAYEKAFEQQAKIKENEIKEANGWDDDEFEQHANDADVVAALSDEALANDVVLDVGEANAWPDLKVDSNAESFIRREINKSVKPPEAVAEVTQADIDAYAASRIDDTKAREAAEKERDRRTAEIDDRMEELHAQYDDRVEKAKARGDIDRAEKLEKAREKKQQELDRQRKEAEKIDIEAKKKEMAKSALETSRNEEIRRRNDAYESARATAEAQAYEKLGRYLEIQRKLGKGKG